MRLKMKNLNISWQGPLSYRNQSIDLQSKSIDWFLHDNGLRHERVNIMQVYWKIQILGENPQKQYIGGNCLKREAWTVCRFKGSLVKKRGWIFLGGRWGAPMHTMISLWGKKRRGRSNSIGILLFRSTIVIQLIFASWFGVTYFEMLLLGRCQQLFKKILTHSRSLFPFCTTPWKHQKTSGFLMFRVSVGIESKYVLTIRQALIQFSGHV